MNKIFQNEKNKYENLANLAFRAERNLNKSLNSNISDLMQRKVTGAFYTPFDVAKFVWITICSELDISIKNALTKIIKKYHILDPCSGSGIFFLAYMDLLDKYNLQKVWYQSNQKIYMNDLNIRAIEFVKDMIDNLGISKKFILEAQDGIDFLHNWNDDRPPLIIGNPPYAKISNNKTAVDDATEFPNIFAKFVNISCELFRLQGGIVSLLVPLSICFSKSFINLRREILKCDGGKIFINFDNIPDSVFSQGKLDSDNTNTAISQRITLLTLISGKNNFLMSSDLLSWSRLNRKEVFSNPPVLSNVSPYSEKLIIPKTTSTKLIKILNSEGPKIGDFLYSNTSSDTVRLYYCTTARNFLSVGLECFRSTGISSLEFSDSLIRNAIFYYLCSKQALLLWKAIGDGFHVTKSNLYNMPLPITFLDNFLDFNEKGLILWKAKTSFEKIKNNAGIKNLTYDFTGQTMCC